MSYSKEDFFSMVENMKMKREDMAKRQKLEEEKRRKEQIEKEKNLKKKLINGQIIYSKNIRTL